jgi:hypothetical protein
VAEQRRSWRLGSDPTTKGLTCRRAQPETGYIWIWGGPYDADDVLQDVFSGVVPLEVIQRLAAI